MQEMYSALNDIALLVGKAKHIAKKQGRSNDIQGLLEEIAKATIWGLAHGSPYGSKEIKELHI